MKYISTRGQAPVLSFEDVVLAGLATDGGLYVPEFIPQLAPHELVAMQSLPYTELAYKIMQPFIGDALGGNLKMLIERAYRDFRHTAIAPLKQLDSNHFLLELFHGPTLAFKDFALQFLGQALNHILSARGQRGVVVGATSGDTGSAAIAGCAACDKVDVFILYPDGRVSEVQRRQMTGVPDANVHAIALKGTFDDCQDIVKALFADAAFRAHHKLIAVNSINWARILAQVVYYFYAALRLGAPAREVSFSVPTGNFGDIFAGYIAKRMGLPIKRLIIATNQNDILKRCLETGTYSMGGVTPTLSPSMDIQVSSNFERLLFDLHERNGVALSQTMQSFRVEKKLTLTPAMHARFKEEFSAYAVDDKITTATIKHLYQETGEVLDPHTAVGVAASKVYLAHHGQAEPVVTLATAHPAKFPDAVKGATGLYPKLPPHMQDLFERKERFDVLDNSADSIKRYIDTHMHSTH